MKPIFLKYLAKLYTGFTIRESIGYLDYGEVRAVQIKDLPKNSHDIDTALLTGIDWKYDSKPQFLAPKSILLLARGEPAAYLFNGTPADKVVASNPFIVINLQSDDVLPEYLLWYLNHYPMAKSYFASALRGTSFPILTLGLAKELPVKVPPIAVQQEIIARQTQALKEKKCFEALVKLRQEYNAATAEHLLNTY